MSVRDRHRCCECEVVLASHPDGAICPTCKEEQDDRCHSTDHDCEMLASGCWCHECKKWMFDENA